MNPRSGEVDLLATFEHCAAEPDHYGVLLEGEPIDLETLPADHRSLPNFWRE